MVTGGTFGHPVRSIRGPFIRYLEEVERKGISEEEFIAFGAGTLRAAIVEGDTNRGSVMAGQSAGLVTNRGSVMAGQSAGLVHDIVPARVVVERVLAEAEEAIQRSVAFVEH
jgi:enoyl-[acyl-carrier protein] reductase II